MSMHYVDSKKTVRDTCAKYVLQIAPFVQKLFVLNSVLFEN